MNRRPAFTCGPEKMAKFTADRLAEQARNRADLTARLIEAYLTEPDRAYAEDFYGDMLRERGVNTEGLGR